MATKIRVSKKDPPVKAEVSETIIAPKTVLNDRADVRDLLSMMVGGGNTSLTSDDGRANFSRLKGLVGEKAAQKLVTNATLYNQRPEVQKLSPEQRVQGFYSQGSSDPEISDYLKQGMGIGYGVGHGFRTSPLLGNISLTGRNTNVQGGDMAAASKIKTLIRPKSK